MAAEREQDPRATHQAPASYQQVAAELGAMVADHVRHLIDWAEHSADDLRRQALDEVSTDREAVRRNAGLALARIDLTETKVTQLLQDLREDVQRIAEAADAASQSPQADSDAGTRTPEFPPGVGEDARPAAEHEPAAEQTAVAGEHASPIEEPAVGAPGDSRATGGPAPARDDVTPTGEPAAEGDALPPSAAAAGDDVPATGQPAAGGEDARPITAEPAAAGDDTGPMSEPAAAGDEAPPRAEPAAAGDEAPPRAEPAAARDDWPSVQQAAGDAPHPSEERSDVPSKRQGGGWLGRRRPTA